MWWLLINDLLIKRTKAHVDHARLQCSCDLWSATHAVGLDSKHTLSVCRNTRAGDQRREWRSCCWSSEKQTQSNPKTLIKRTGHTAVHGDFSAAKSSVYAMSHRKILYGFIKHCKLKDKADYSYHKILSSTHLYEFLSSAEQKIAILILIFFIMLVRMFVDSSHWLTL